MAPKPAPKKAPPAKTTPAKKPAAFLGAAGAAVPAAKKIAAGASEAKAKPPGRPSIYTAELAAQICEHIAQGKSLRTIAELEGMPHQATIMAWLDGSRPEFSEQYARAREAQADKLAEEALQIADEDCTMVRADKHGSKDDDGSGNTEVVFDATAVARNRLRVDTRKWLASKMAPKKYGEKLVQEHTGANGGAIQVHSTVTFVEPKPRPDDE